MSINKTFNNKTCSQFHLCHNCHVLVTVLHFLANYPKICDPRRQRKQAFSSMIHHLSRSHLFRFAFFNPTCFLPKIVCTSWPLPVSYPLFSIVYLMSSSPSLPLVFLHHFCYLNYVRFQRDWCWSSVRLNIYSLKNSLF